MEVQLLVTCLADQLAPEVGEATVDLLERLGHRVRFPEAQTCCGQPAFNDGFSAEAAALAARTVEIFSAPAPVVVPSGSCATMIRHFYPGLLERGPHGPAARALAARTFELSEFLVRVLGRTDVGAGWSGRVTYHDSCHLLRELGVRDEPRRLLAGVAGVELVEMAYPEHCCGFGGAFAVKFPEVSSAILDPKVESIIATGADAVVANDTGCLLQLAGGLRRRGSTIRTLHLAEILASQASR
ncbi:MAG: (Fe-S)-binding protein [Deltaproteobacteria bacterium]|nr:(Fe-S)-binding protein [Deltaproteobacteria bacterium]